MFTVSMHSTTLGMFMQWRERCRKSLKFTFSCRYGSGTSAHWRVIPPLPHFTPNFQFTAVATITQNGSEEGSYFDLDSNHRILSSLSQRHRRFSSGSLCRWTESPLTAHHVCARQLHTSVGCCEEDKSMVEKAVDSMKQKKQAKVSNYTVAVVWNF